MVEGVEIPNQDELGIPTSPEDLFARLDSLGIAHKTVHHPPVYTVEEAKFLRGEIAGAHIKNLFLRDKKKRMWLLVALEHQALDLKRLGSFLGAKSLSFATPERLMTFLGVKPGSVTPFSIINDKDCQVQVLLDKEIWGHEAVNCHPLVNWMTTSVSPEDLLQFLNAEGHPPGFLDFTQL